MTIADQMKLRIQARNERIVLRHVIAQARICEMMASACESRAIPDPHIHLHTVLHAPPSSTGGFGFDNLPWLMEDISKDLSIWEHGHGIPRRAVKWASSIDTPPRGGSHIRAMALSAGPVRISFGRSPLPGFVEVVLFFDLAVLRKGREMIRLELVMVGAGDHAEGGILVEETFRAFGTFVAFGVFI